MPPRVGAFANIQNLRQFTEQARAAPNKTLNAALRHVSPRPGMAPLAERTLESIVDSANGRHKQELALSALYEALAGSYGEKVAAKVFTRMSGKLFSGTATLSASLINQAERTAKQVIGKRPNRASGRSVSPADDSKAKPDVGQKDKAPDNDKARPDVQRKAKAPAKDPMSRLRAIQKKKNIDKKENLQKRLAARKRMNTGSASPKSTRQLALNNKRMQADLFLSKVGRHGSSFSLGKLLSAASNTQHVRLPPKDLDAAKAAIRNAFIAYPSPAQLATMTDKDKADRIAIPALCDFFVELRQRNAPDK